MERTKNLSRSKLVLLLAISCFFFVACGPNNKNFIRADQVTAEYDPVAEIEVHRRGFWLFWIIPLKVGWESAAQGVMEEETLKSYPKAEAVLDYKVVDSYGQWFWIDGTRITGTIVKKKQ